MLLSELDFGSYLTYTPRPNSKKPTLSKQVMYNIKSDKMRADPPINYSGWLALRLKEDIENLPFKDFFNLECSLVPVPKSSLMQSDELWVPKNIADALSNNGLGKTYLCMERIQKVPKSATSPRSKRPKAQDHYDSLRVKQLLYEPKEIVLVDDVVTRGATLLGCASRLCQTFPDIPIKCFAMMRTISNASEFKGIRDPCIGKITLKNGNTFRNP